MSAFNLNATISETNPNFDGLREVQNTILMADATTRDAIALTCSEHLPTHIGDKRTITSIMDEQVRICFI